VPERQLEAEIRTYPLPSDRETIEALPGLDASP
jgi:hypothetical protein